VREKDGVWAVLSWLSILASARKPVKDVVIDHWRRFGRSYYQRHDYEGLDAKVAAGMIAELQEKLSGLQGNALAGSHIAMADDFSYTDPVDHSVSAHQGIRIILADGSRIIGRLSGTGTEGATLRIYLERYNKEDVLGNIDEILLPLAQAAGEIFQLKARFHRDKATIIT
jgi:phosphoglucomutase